MREITSRQARPLRQGNLHGGRSVVTVRAAARRRDLAGSVALPRGAARRRARRSAPRQLTATWRSPTQSGWPRSSAATHHRFRSPCHHRQRYRRPTSRRNNSARLTWRSTARRSRPAIPRPSGSGTTPATGGGDRGDRDRGSPVWELERDYKRQAGAGAQCAMKRSGAPPMASRYRRMTRLFAPWSTTEAPWIPATRQWLAGDQRATLGDATASSPVGQHRLPETLVRIDFCRSVAHPTESRGPIDSPAWGISWARRSRSAFAALRRSRLLAAFSSHLWRAPTRRRFRAIQPSRARMPMERRS